MADPQEIAKWRRAHQNIEVPDAGLMTVAPFPSLWASDFAVLLEARGFPREIGDFVKAIGREVAWVYDNWQKAQHDGDPKRLIETMLNEATTQGAADYSMVRKYLRDFANAHGIPLASEDASKPAWMDALGAGGGIAQGAGNSGTDGDVRPPAAPFTVTGGITAPPSPMEAA